VQSTAHDESLSVSEVMKSFTLSVICEAAFEYQISPEGKEMLQLQEHIINNENRKIVRNPLRRGSLVTSFREFVEQD